MTVGELKRLLRDVPDSLSVAIDYEAGSCRSEEIGTRVEDGLLILDADPDLPLGSGDHRDADDVRR